MPANLTPQYQKAEQAYRRAQSAQEQVDCLEEMLQLIPKHKGTEKLQADLKSRLKEARSELQAEKRAPRRGPSYRFPHQGAGQVVIVGGPNAGKSRIVRELTNAEPVVADYPFSTHEPVPGMMPWEDVKVQLIDTPPVTSSHIEPYMTNLARGADAALLVMNGSSDDAPDETAAVIAEFARRKTLLSDRTGFDEDDFSVVHVRTLLVVTRGHDPDCDTRLELFHEAVSERGLAPVTTPQFDATGDDGQVPVPVLKPSDEQVPRRFPTIRVDLDRPEDREELRNAIYRFLDVIRVYTKAPGKPPDDGEPFTIPRGGTVEELATKVHRELAETFKFARVWGDSAHDGQTVGREHVLCDRDLVELH